MERRERSDRSGISTAKSEFVWGDATEGAVGAVAVVVLAVRVGVGSGVSHVLEFFHVQKFVPEAAVEAFGVAVLPRAARFNVKRLDAQRGQPLLNRLGDKLRSIVAPNVLGHAIDGKELSQAINYVLAGHVS